MTQRPQLSAPSEKAVEPAGEFLEKPVPLPTAGEEVRRFPRFSYRARVQALIHPLLGDQQAEPVSCWLLTRDLSRGGLNLLHSEQLSLGQRIDITLHDAASRRVEVVWCRRLANRCYSIGCRFTKGEPGSDPTVDIAQRSASEGQPPAEEIS